MTPLRRVLLWVIALSLGSPGQTVCELNCQKNRDHTTCARAPAWCRPQSRGVDAASRSAILKAHNDHRSQVALGNLAGFPPAADMQELLWDDGLAKGAQAHAELCQFAHDDTNNRCTRRFDVAGQNIAISTSTAPLGAPVWPPPIFDWFNESWEYPSSRVKAFQSGGLRGGMIGHFTQVIWAKSRYVGCGYTYYHYTGGVGYPYKQLYTCNYGPSGNYRGKPVYQEGGTCTACPAGTICNHATGLCSDGTNSGAGGDMGQGDGDGRGQGGGGGRGQGGGGGRGQGDGGGGRGQGDGGGRGPDDGGGKGHDDGSTAASNSWMVFVFPFLLGVMVPLSGWASWWCYSRKQGAADGGAAPIVPAEETAASTATSTPTSTQ
ncbi:scoloptoxin SSD43-like [Haemaphysalis longicornis]